MPVNLDKPQNWKADTMASVDMYNDWFMKFAPKAFRDTRVKVSLSVEQALKDTDFLRDVSPELLAKFPGVLPTLRKCTCPPLAQDRVVGLAGVSKNLVNCMEDTDKPRIPPKMAKADLFAQLGRIGDIIEKMADKDILVWLDRGDDPTEAELVRASTIVADRLCGAVTDPIVRNAQEKRQLATIAAWLDARGYQQLPAKHGLNLKTMPAGTYSFRMNVPVAGGTVNIPIDALIKPLTAAAGDLPLMFEAKSAGDFTNVNKRRKEEAQKASQLRAAYGAGVQFHLYLCGYFDAGYLGYEAAEGIDWVWEHRTDDLALFGL